MIKLRETVMTRHFEVSPEEVKRRFGKYDIRNKDVTNIPPVFDRASVLVPLYQVDKEWHVLLTVRSKHLRTHSGTVAFPGGKQDPDDLDDIQTALREANEEIGLDPNLVEVIAVLPPSFVRPNTIVSVIVGIIPLDFKPTVNQHEVDRSFSLPLNRFLKDDFTTLEFDSFGSTFQTFSFSDNVDGKDNITWGFTAAYCMKSAMILFQDSKKRIYNYTDNYVTLECLWPCLSYTDYLLTNYGTSKL